MRFARNRGLHVGGAIRRRSLSSRAVAAIARNSTRVCSLRPEGRFTRGLAAIAQADARNSPRAGPLHEVRMNAGPMVHAVGADGHDPWARRPARPSRATAGRERPSVRRRRLLRSLPPLRAGSQPEPVLPFPPGVPPAMGCAAHSTRTVPLSALLEAVPLNSL
jgi:hypothetical protein